MTSFNKCSTISLYRYAPVTDPGVVDREWHFDEQFGTVAGSTTAAGRALRLGHDFTLPTTTVSVNPEPDLNDTDNTALELDIQVVDTYITVPEGGAWIRYAGASEGYWAIEVGYCCGPLQLAAELGYQDREDAQAIVGPVFLPEGQHVWRGWNIDTGGTNSSHGAQYSADGVTFTGVPFAGLEFSQTKRKIECNPDHPECDPVPDGWSKCYPTCTGVLLDPFPADTYTPEEPRQIEVTCSQLQSLGNQGNLIVGCEYIVTDYNRGTLGPARIHTHAVSATEVSHSVSVDTQWDDSAWMGRWDPDTCRIYDLFDNLGNKIRSDNGDEIEVFPWGSTLVTGNEFTDFDFNYGGGTVRDNVGHPTARLDTSGTAIAERNTIQNGGSYAILSDSAIVRDTVIESGGRLVISKAATLNDSRISETSYVRYDGLDVLRTVWDSFTTMYALGGVGTIDDSNFSSSYIDLRNAADVDFDEVNAEAYGYISGNGSARIRLLRVTASESGNVTAFAGAVLDARYSKATTGGYIYSRQGELLVQYSNTLSGGGIDQNSTGANSVLRVTSDNSRIEFRDTSTDNDVVWSTATALGYIQFRGDTNGVTADRVDVSSGGRITWIDAEGGFARYVEISSISYAQIQNTVGVRVSQLDFSSNGRMLIDGGTGEVYAVQLSSIAYLRLLNHGGILRYSDFDSYFYYYMTGNTGIKQALDGSGRRTHTETNLAGTITGTPVQNW